MAENKRKKIRVQNKPKAKVRKTKETMKKTLKSLTPSQRKALNKGLKKKKTIRQNEDWLKKSKQHNQKNYV